MDDIVNLFPALAHLVLQEDEDKNKMRLYRRMIRDTQNPFETLSEKSFKKSFRFSKQLATLLINELEPHLQNVCISAIPSYLKVLATLNFLGQGSYQNNVGMSSALGLSQTTISRSIQTVCQLLAQHLMPHWIHFPRNHAERASIQKRFFDKFHFRGVLGCIDGTHVAISAPSINDEDHPPHTYMNRKSYHSINVMLICDSDCRILACDARFPGSVHDAAIWRSSNIRRHMRSQYEDGDTGSRLIGDSSYGLEPWLFTPFAAVEANTPEARYNALHVSTRNVIERTNGILKGRFRCLLRHRVLHYAPDLAAYIIYAAATLHNIAKWANLEIAEEDIILENDVPEDNHVDAVLGDNLLQLGRNAKAEYIRINNV